MVISVASQKGGTGKTSTSISLAAGLARKGKRVLLVDVGSQANSSKVLLADYPKLTKESTLVRVVPLIRDVPYEPYRTRQGPFPHAYISKRADTAPMHRLVHQPRRKGVVVVTRSEEPAGEVVGVGSDAKPAGRRVDFFVSHAGRDQAWAEWLAWQLTEAGYTVELDVWDWTPGQDFVARIERALTHADRVLAVWSEAYFRSTFAGAELRAAFVRPRGGAIVPVLVEPASVPDLYASLIYVDLVGLDEAAAAARLRARLVGGPPRTQPPFPAVGPRAVGKPAFAGRLPTVWNVRPRNPHFVGRTELLSELRGRLRTSEHTVAVQALHGLGGVGKTQLAIEYAHRFAADYELVGWLDAEQPALIAGQLAALAGPLGLPPRDSVPTAVDQVRAELRRHSPWLLIFDNAERPRDLVDYLPGGSGHVLVTSRYPGWGGLGGRLEVDVLSRPETVALLRRRLPELDQALAEQLAAELGDLPLAAAQAAGYLEATGLPPEAYLRRFRTRRASLLARGDVVGYEGRLDTTWTLSLERLRTNAPAAVQLLQLAALLAPEPIPLRLFTKHAELLGEPLRTVAADPDDLDDLVGLIVGYSLLRREADRIQLHRLVQAVIRHQLAPADQQCEQERVLALLLAAHPGDLSDPAWGSYVSDPGNWDSYAELTPHVLATSALGDDRPAIRQLVLDTLDYLHTRGDERARRAVAAPLLDRWQQALGPDHPDSLRLAAILSVALNQLNEPAPARRLGEDTLGRCRRVLGPDHPTTLTSAVTLTGILYQLNEPALARRLGEDTLGRCRRVLGADHPTTLTSATVLTLSLADLGEAEPARTLGQDTMERCHRVLGPDHSLALLSAVALANVLLRLGESEQARALAQDTMDRGRLIYGGDHPFMVFATQVAALASPLHLTERGAERARPDSG